MHTLRSAILRPTTIAKHLQASLLPCFFFFSSTASQLTKQMPPRPKLPDSEIHEVFLKGSGPGGQKINKTNSAVQLRHLPTGVVVKYQDTRSREQNRKIARQLLAQRVDEMQNGYEARSKVVEREKAKKKASAVKKSRRKYRALEQDKQAAETEGDASVDALRGVSGDKDVVHEGSGLVSKLRAAREHAKSSDASSPEEHG